MSNFYVTAKEWRLTSTNDIKILIITASVYRLIHTDKFLYVASFICQSCSKEFLPAGVNSTHLYTGLPYTDRVSSQTFSVFTPTKKVISNHTNAFCFKLS